MNARTTDTSTFVYPMKALRTCKMAPGVEFQAGEVFDAKTIENVNAFKRLKSAQVVPRTAGEAPAAAGPTLGTTETADKAKEATHDSSAGSKPQRRGGSN